PASFLQAFYLRNRAAQKPTVVEVIDRRDSNPREQENGQTPSEQGRWALQPAQNPTSEGEPCKRLQAKTCAQIVEMDRDVLALVPVLEEQLIVRVAEEFSRTRLRVVLGVRFHPGWIAQARSRSGDPRCPIMGRARIDRTVASRHARPRGP